MEYQPHLACERTKSFHFATHDGRVRTYKNGRTNAFLIYYSFLSYVNFILSNVVVFDMEDSKLKEILEKVISKTSDMLDEKFAKF